MTELTCKELTELITDYLEERLPREDRVRFEDHLSLCDACVIYVEQMKTITKTLGASPRLAIPASMESELLQAFRRWKKDAPS